MIVAFAIVPPIRACRITITDRVVVDADRVGKAVRRRCVGVQDRVIGDDKAIADLNRQGRGRCRVVKDEIEPGRRFGDGQQTGYVHPVEFSRNTSGHERK